MSDLKLTRFDEFIVLQRGFDLPRKEMTDGPYPVVGSTSIIGYHNRYKVNPPGVVTGRSGSLGSVQYICDKYWPHNTSLWAKDFKGNFPRYVYYHLLTLDLKRFNSGVGVPTLNRNDLDTLEIAIPPLSTQHKIAAILSAYDDLIENNLRRIKILEEMAQLIYREWFVNFRFPGHENVKMVDSEVGIIPEGWEAYRLGDICELRKDTYRDDKHGGLKLVDLARMLPRTLSLGETGGPGELTTSRIVFEEDDILFSSIRPYLHKVALAPFKGVTNVSVLVIRPSRPDLRALLAVMLSSENAIRWADQYSTGTKMPVIKWENLRTMLVALPERERLSERFQECVGPMVEAIKSAFFRNVNLRHTRDLLLPKLISGELDVSELDIDTEEEPE